MTHKCLTSGHCNRVRSVRLSALDLGLTYPHSQIALSDAIYSRLIPDYSTDRSISSLLDVSQCRCAVVDELPVSLHSSFFEYSNGRGIARHHEA